MLWGHPSITLSLLGDRSVKLITFDYSFHWGGGGGGGILHDYCALSYYNVKPPFHINLSIFQTKSLCLSLIIGVYSPCSLNVFQLI